MISRPPRSTLTYTLSPHTALFRSCYRKFAAAPPWSCRRPCPSGGLLLLSGAMTPGPSLAAARPSSTRPAWSVLMVCTGNICRSPTAHGLLRHSLQQAGLHEVVHVDSAGPHG